MKIDLKTLRLITIVLTVCFFILLAIFIFLSIRDEGRDKHSGERNGGICTDTPQFAEYLAQKEDPKAAKASAVDFTSNPSAENFKTAISDWFSRGADTDRYYAVAEWGCGAGCQEHAIIDIRTGKITAFGNLTSSYGVAYRPDSRMIILNPSWNVQNELSRPATTSTQYYEVKDGKPRLICKVINPPK